MKPVIQDFPDPQYLSLDEEEVDYVLLTSTVVFMGLEILYQRRCNLSREDERYLLRSIVELAELDTICRAIDTIEDEYSRLTKLDARLEVLTSLWMMGGLLSAGLAECLRRHPSINYDIKAIDNDSNLLKPSKEDNSGGIQWPNNISDLESSIPIEDDQAQTSSLPNPSYHRAELHVPPPFAHYYRNLHIQFYLKLGHSCDIDFVNSISLRNDSFTISTCTGISVSVEEGATVSDSQGAMDKVTVQGSSDMDLALTVLVPPGKSYLIEDVIRIEHDVKMRMWTKLHAKNGMIWIGYGLYKISVEDEERKVIVRNVY